MNWLTKYRLRNYVRNSIWPVPFAAIPAALVFTPLVRWVDDQTRWHLLGYTPDGARGLLSAITPAALTMVVLILSTLLLSVQLASSQFSPRLIGGLLARRGVKVCLFVFVFSYVFCSATLGRVGERVPQLLVLLAIFSTMASMGAGLFLIDYMAKELRPVRMLSQTAQVGRRVIEQVYPHLVAHIGEAPVPLAASFPQGGKDIAHTRTSGVLLAIDLQGVVALAAEIDGMIEVVPQVGDFVARGDPLFRIYGASPDRVLPRLRSAVAIGNERTADQDPAFAFRILVDVACRALSAAINDPTTAVLAIDQIHQLLRQVGLRQLDNGHVPDAAGSPRVVYRTPDWEDFVLLAVTEIRQYGCDSIQVVRRLRAMLENLSATIAPERADVLRQQLRLLDSSVQRSFQDPEDRTHACTGDYQGVGSAGTTEQNGDGRAPPRVA